MRYKNSAEREWDRMVLLGNKISAAKARGVCTHGWIQGPPGPAGRPTTIATCLDCGQTWPTVEEAYAANRAAIDNL